MRRVHPSPLRGPVLGRGGLGFALSLAACSSPDLASQCPLPSNVTGPSDPRYQAALRDCLSSQPGPQLDPVRKDIDILFLIDNSSGMAAKQQALVQDIGRFIQRIDAIGVGYHLGVATSDIGTLPVSGAPFSDPGDGRCGTLKGDDGQLQNVPCRSRTANVSSEFATACAALCPDPTFVPRDRWLAKEAGVTNVPVKIVNGIDVGPALAFQCIGLVGDGGCGVEGQLEAARRALDGHRADNAGFMRDSSALAVIYVTDEDDCSVQLAQRVNLDPMSMSCSTTDPDPAYPCYNLDYRCIAKDVQCSEPLDTPGAKSGCSERPTSFLEPIAKYSRFFAALRSADRLVLAGIWSPSLLDYYARGSSGDGQLVVASDAPPSTATNVLNRGRGASAACFNSRVQTGDPDGLSGQAQLRLGLFKNRFDPGIWVEHSICDTASYANALDEVADKLARQVLPHCLGGVPTLDTQGNPECLVGFIDPNQGGQPTDPLPLCSAGCCSAWASSPRPWATDPSIAAGCTQEAADCYCAVPSTQGLCRGSAVAGVWRVGDAPLPAGQVLSFQCVGTRSALLLQ